MVKPVRRRRRAARNDAVTAYARTVDAGRILAGRPVRLACARHLRDLDAQGTPAFPFVFTPARAERLFSFFRDFLTLDDGAPFELMPWLQFVFGSIAGWVDAEGLRRFQTGFLETAKGTGKTPAAAGFGLFGLVADDEQSAEVYSLGVNGDQAIYLFQFAKAMAERSDDLRDLLDIGERNLAWLDRRSFFRPLTSEGRSLDNKRPHIALIDELHEHPSDVIADKMKLGFKGRAQPFRLELTNSGHDKTSVCWDHHDYALKVLDRVIDDERWFAYVCQLDPCEACREAGATQPSDGCPRCDDWTDERVWLKTHPSLGVTIQVERIREFVRTALHSPREQNRVKRLYFCLWTQSHTIWLPTDTWDACRVEPLPPRRDVPSAAAFDMSMKVDLTAGVVAQRIEDPPETEPEEVELEEHDNGQTVRRLWSVNYSIDLHPYFWIPEDTLIERVRHERIPYDVWKRLGHLRTTPGPVIDHHLIHDQFVTEIGPRFNVQRIGYDPYNATEFAVGLRDRAKYTVVEVGQGRKLSEFIKLFEALVRLRRVRHTGNLVLAWCVSNSEPKLAASLSGEKLSQNAHNMTAAVNKIGGASKLTEREQARVNATLTKALDKYKAMGKDAPAAMVALEKATRRAEAPTAALTTKMIAIGTAVGTFVGKMAYDAVRSLGRGLLDLASSGIKLAPIVSSFERLTASVGQSSDAMLTATRTATKGLITDLDIMAASNKAILLGLPVTADEMGVLGTAAVTLGKAMKQDAGKSLDDLLISLGRSSPKILDNLGLVVKLGDANKAFAKETGIVGRSLTGAESKLAFYNVAVGAAKEKMETLGGVQLTVADQVTRLANTFRNFTDWLGVAIAMSPVLNAAFGGIADATDRAFGANQVTKVQALIGYVNSFAITLVDAAQLGVTGAGYLDRAWNLVKLLFTGTASVIYAVGLAFENLVAGAASLASTLPGVGDQFAWVAEKARLAADATRLVQAGFHDQAQAALDGVKGNSALQRTLDGVAGTLSTLRQRMVEASTAQVDSADIALSLTKAMDDTGDSTEEATRNMDAYTTSVRSMEAAHQSAVASLANTLFGYDDIERARQYADAIGDVDNISRMNAETQREVAEVMRAGIEALVAAGLSADEFTGHLEVLRLKATETGRDAAFELQRIQAEAANASAGLATVLQGLTIIGQSPVTLEERNAEGFQSRLSQRGVVLFDDYGNAYEAPARARGGPVTAGQPYTVGERGPELFVPKVAGTVLPTGAGGSPVTVNVNVGHFIGSDESAARQLAAIVSGQVMQTLATNRKLDSI